MDQINSRNLTYLDSYIHLFPVAGTYVWRILFLGIGFGRSQHTVDYQIVVTESKTPLGEGQFFNISLRWDASKKLYTPDVDKLTIGSNDIVQFHATTTTNESLPYTIQGLDAKGNVQFMSSGLEQGSAFAHFFMEPGDYHILAGTQPMHLAVSSHQKFEPKVYEDMVKTSKIITLSKKNTSSAPTSKSIIPETTVPLVTGQTIYFTVGDGKDYVVTMA